MNSRRILVGLLFGLGLLALAAAQAPNRATPPPGFTDKAAEEASKDVDSLFNDPSPSPSPGSQATPPPITLDSLTQAAGIRLFGSAQINLGMAAGWQNNPNTTPFTETSFYGGVQGIASIGFEARPNSDFRIRGNAQFSYPESKATIPELFIDYNLDKTVFFRVGIYSYGWGYGRYLRLDDLPGRMVENRDVGTEFNVKVNVPIGLGGITALARARTPYFAVSDQLRVEEAGYGLLGEIVTGPIEWVVGGYYQRALTPRALVGFKTTIAGFDIFGESILAFQIAGSSLTILPSFNAGVFYEPSGVLRIYAEYAYNGERPVKEAIVADALAIRGHNSIVGIRINPPSTPLRFALAWQQNYTDGSLLISPVVEFNPVSQLNFQIGVPVLIGDNGTYLLENRPIPGLMRVGLVVLVRFTVDF